MNFGLPEKGCLMTGTLEDSRNARTHGETWLLMEGLI
jgi:hypothetical protein